MKRFVIALKILKIDDDAIIYIIQNLNSKQIKKIFTKQYNEVLGSYLVLAKYVDIFQEPQTVKEALDTAKHILKKNKELGIKTLIYGMRGYPENLEKMETPPPILYIKGKGFTKKDIKSLACVGTRKPTTFSEKAIEYLVPNWVNEKFNIIAGLAVGVDTIAHKICLNNSGRTIAVLAHGLDMIYPKENMDLSKEILNNGGTLVSEYPVGTKPEKYTFVNRNRIIVGLSLGTTIFECKEKSGTMHSVNYTFDQNKPVFYPNPGDDTTNQYLGGIRSLLNNSNAVMINDGNNFEIPIFYFGYKLRNSPKRLLQIKQNSITELFHNINNISISNIVQSFQNKEETKRISVEVNCDRYEKFKKIASKNNLSTKELLNALMEGVIEGNAK